MGVFFKFFFFLGFVFVFVVSVALCVGGVGGFCSYICVIITYLLFF